MLLQVLEGSDLEYSRPDEHLFAVTLPGTRKLTTQTQLHVGEHALAVHAFVARNPDENHEAVYRWLLERNLRMYAVAFGVDHSGDIYLDGRLPLHAVNADEVDRLLGSVLTYADESFNAILELGFATAIRKEWRWRRERGESTGNLEAFRGWLER
ncbi:MAG: YbjN domain-containing protein [Actinomycetota bacterium]|nr:YbjN domain-containing protein [Actinomycetota bacterium]